LSVCVNPIAFPTAIPASAPVPPRFLQAEDALSHPFSIMFRNAQAGPATETPEIEGPKPPPTRKAAVNPKQSSNPQNAKSGNLVVPVQAPPGQQAQPISMRLALSFDSGEDRDSDANSAPDAVSGSTGGSIGNPSPQAGTEALPQLAPPPSAVAFSLNLQNVGASDRKPGVLEQQSADSVQVRPPSVLSDSTTAGNGENSSNDTGSHQPGAEADRLAEMKPESTLPTRPDVAPSEIPASTGNPAQGLANAPSSFAPGSTPQAFGKSTRDAGPAAPMETSAPPAPPSARQIDLTVPNDAGRQVDIRILQRGSDVQVTVRTPDGDLAQSLRHNLPELSATLSRNGLREEALSTAQSHSAGDGGSGENSSNNGGQAWQDPEDRDQPANAGRSKDQTSGAFAEIIHNEKKST